MKAKGSAASQPAGVMPGRPPQSYPFETLCESLILFESYPSLISVIHSVAFVMSSSISLDRFLVVFLNILVLEPLVEYLLLNQVSLLPVEGLVCLFRSKEWYN